MLIGAFPLRRHVYPVPDLRNPFLGVHFTVTPHGGAKIGPTAIPAWWREHYHGVAAFRLREFAEIAGLQAGLWLRNDFEFRRLALRELRKYRKQYLVALARQLVPSASDGAFTHWGPSGLRAQLWNVRHRKLEMDFRYEGDHRSFHVLNAVSPAFTCALPFSAHVVDQIATQIA